MATPAFAIQHQAPGDTYADDGCMFVGRRTPGDSMYDDDEILDSADDDEVFRSTTMQVPFAFTASRHNQYHGSSMDITHEFVSGAVTASTCHEVSQTLVPKVEFSSIAEEYPLHSTSNASLTSIRPSSTTSYRSCGVEAALGAQVSNSRGGAEYFCGRVTPVRDQLGPIQEDDRTNVMTVLDLLNSMEGDPDEDRKSPFADTVLQLPKLYQYRATKTEEEDMEVNAQHCLY